MVWGALKQPWYHRSCIIGQPINELRLVHSVNKTFQRQSTSYYHTKHFTVGYQLYDVWLFEQFYTNKKITWGLIIFSVGKCFSVVKKTIYRDIIRELRRFSLVVVNSLLHNWEMDSTNDKWVYLIFLCASTKIKKFLTLSYPRFELPSENVRWVMVCELKNDVRCVISSWKTLENGVILQPYGNVSATISRGCSARTVPSNSFNYLVLVPLPAYESPQRSPAVLSLHARQPGKPPAVASWSFPLAPGPFSRIRLASDVQRKSSSGWTTRDSITKSSDEW